MNEIDKFMICEKTEVSNSNWTHPETQLFISYYKKYASLKIQGHKQNSIFSLLAKKLLEHGYQKTRLDCRRKFNNLMRTFRSIDKKPDKSHQKFPYYFDMKDILEINDNSEPVDPNTIQEIEEIEVSRKTDQIPVPEINPWQPDEIKCLIAYYGLKKMENPDQNIDWLDILINLQNNGYALNRSDQECRTELHKNLRNYINVVSLGCYQSLLEYPFYEDFQTIMENFEEFNTDLSDVDSDDDKSSFWTLKETFKLIELYKTHYSLIKSNAKNCWKVITEKLAESGFTAKTPQKVRRKFDNLKRTYKICIQSGREKTKFPYLNALREIFENQELMQTEEDESQVFREVFESNEKLPDFMKTPEKAEPPQRVLKGDEKWDEQETKILVDLYRQLRNDLPVQELWKYIADTLNEVNYKKTALQCKLKWRQLFMQFNASQAQNSTTERPLYSDEIEKIVQEDTAMIKVVMGPPDSKVVQEEMAQEMVDEIIEEDSLGTPWTDQEVHELISLCKQYGEAQPGNSLVKIKWSLIQDLLKRKNIQRAPEDCSRKWANLNRTYRVCLVKKLINEHKDIKFKYFQEMFDHFGNSLLLDYNSKKAAKELTNDKIRELIRLKYQFSKIHKSNVLTDQQWAEISDILNVGMKGSVLRICYFSLFKKYKQLKQEGSGTSWEFFKSFDDLYSGKFSQSLRSEISVKSEEILEDSNIIIEEITQEFVEPEKEGEEPAVLMELEAETVDVDYNFDYIARNFNQICKFCLKCEEIENLREVAENPDLLEKIDELFYKNVQEQEKLNMNISDRICVSCLSQIEASYEFRKRYQESTAVLKEFSEKFVLTNLEVPDDGAGEVLELCEEDYNEIIETSDVDEEDDGSFWDDPKEEEFMKPKIERKMKTCDVCGKSVVDLKSHMVTHDKVCPFICNYQDPTSASICGRSFPFKERLRRHIRTHLQIKDYVCDFESCGARFVCNSSLSKHRTIHEKIMKFQCEVCSIKFYRQSSYKKHVSTHGIGLKYFCPICPNKKGFLWKGYFEDHMNLHKGIRPYVCGVCGPAKAFSSRKCLRNHMKKHSQKIEPKLEETADQEIIQLENMVTIPSESME